MDEIGRTARGAARSREHRDERVFVTEIGQDVLQGRGEEYERGTMYGEHRSSRPQLPLTHTWYCPGHTPSSTTPGWINLSLMPSSRRISRRQIA